MIDYPLLFYQIGKRYGLELVNHFYPAFSGKLSDLVPDKDYSKVHGEYVLFYNNTHVVHVYLDGDLYEVEGGPSTGELDVHSKADQ